MTAARSTFLVAGHAADRAPGASAATLCAGAALAIGLCRYALRAHAPESWDAIGFVLSVDDFDLARFQPHFPGYPVFVALGRAAHALLPSPTDALCAVSAIASALTSAALWRAARHLRSERAAFIAMGLYAAAALPWLTGGAPLSDATGSALLCLAFVALLERRGLAGGLLIALMLGARASYFPFALSFAVAALLWRRDQVARALVGGVLGTLAWAVPFIGYVGAKKLLALGRTALFGHFTSWGGSVATRPDLAARLGALGRDIFFYGLAPRLISLIVFFLLLGFAQVRDRGRNADEKHRSENPRPSLPTLAPSLVLLLPYALWALFGQNIGDEPRHVLPLVLALVLGLALRLDAQPGVAVAAVAALSSATVPALWAHAHTLPPAAQAAAWVSANDHLPRAQTAVFGGRSIRSFHYLTPSLVAQERTWLSEVDVSLERLDVLPRRIFITDEVEVDARRAARVTPEKTFCRDSVLDERQPCLKLSEYSLFGNSTRRAP